MRCIVPTCCNDDASCISQGITFHIFPTEPALCMAWLKALNKENWKPLESSVICSNHFIKNDLYIDRKGQYKIRADAVPIVNLQNFQNVPNDDCWMTDSDVKVCRICFATDCKLYPMTMYKKLDKAYETLTGLSIENEDNLPPYLCAECAQRLLNCIHFRTRSLRAHLLLLDIIKKEDYITLKSLKPVSGDQNPFRSNLRIKHNPTNQYDLEIKYMKSDYILKTEPDEQVIIDVINLDDDSCTIKSENNDTFNENENVETINSPSLQIDTVRVKTEHEDMFNENSPNDDTISSELICGDSFAGSLEDDQQFEEEQKTEHSPNNVEKGEKCYNPLQVHENFKKSPVAIQPENHQFTCELCPYQTQSESRMLSHLKTHAKGKFFNCDICNYKTTRKKFLKDHIRIHSDKAKYSCFICKKLINTKNNLSRHMRIHSGEKTHTCDICSKAFMRQDHYKNHMKMHSDEKPYLCDICNKGFRRQDHYKTHLKLHTSQKQRYACDLCKKLFSRKSNLQNHIKIHSGEKPYSCKICNRTFRRNNNLQKHFKLHSYKPYSCDLCKRCFKSQYDKKIHLRLHSGGGPYKCNECRSTFIFKSHLRLHFQKSCLR